MNKILISAPYIIPFMDRFRPVLERHGLDVIMAEVNERLNEDQILSKAGEFSGTICGDDQYTMRALEACSPQLKVISKWGTGIDSIDKEAAERFGIKLFRTPNAFSMPVADSVMGYVILFARPLHKMDRIMKSGRWEKITGRALNECTLGVVGVGNIGKAVVLRARAFGMKVLGNDIVDISQDFIEETDVEMTALEDLLERSDFVSLNCDLNPTSFHLMNAQSLSIMKTDSVLINMARGQVVDEPALIEALQAGLIAGAALDVFEIEPLPLDSPLLLMDNVLVAAHNGNTSPTAWERVHWNSIRNLLEGLGIAPDFE